ncbi:IucA/IucC family siderophore biosynthesis protein [Teredinibacter sp. KSP-S5-2]|uniref:IucA/IucC family protein n=1 Tax=Teredinibacter sp. KSP-S5-2 TaxID=3034506 RepID=UPI0029344B12|nr:IucA/IucC family siderophore biosynthesis protein [Teredinibacter sp. KSP-S5-2]WNO08277.1 IucA/IucC family siderophore biosynthesis protein [Teredinibacter sp. KSP-S5-2]
MNYSLPETPESVVSHLSPELWGKVNRHLVRKAIAELSHEQVFTPELLKPEGQAGWNQYLIKTDTDQCYYTFNAKTMSLRHWCIDPNSIERYVDGETSSIDALVFFNDVKKILAIPEEKLPVYLDEISSTLYGAAYKHEHARLTSSELVDADYQTFESAMTEGHPLFVANNGRIGFTAQDYHQYAPETGSEFCLYWVAVHKSLADFSCTPELEYERFLRDEIGDQQFQAFKNKLTDKELEYSQYWFMPVHPWQWHTKLSMAFSADIANNNIVPLGIGEDKYLAQQSIRTYFNASQHNKCYVKTSLSILNMGFMRGLSPYYMDGTPAINDYLYELINNDSVLSEMGFSILREVASIGFRNRYYEAALTKDSPYKKMLSALWRESPMPRLKKNERLMTMAALLHVDKHGKPLISELIRQSGYTAKAWLAQYLRAYLHPLLHCFYAYELVFMPHCENLILVLDNYLPVRSIMKDIAEESAILDKDVVLPEKVARLAVEVPEEYKILGIFIDVFDGVFRYMADFLEADNVISERGFWQMVAKSVREYQAEHSDLSEKFERYDIFAPDFLHSCLNRLQLKNNLQMVDLSDTASSLIMIDPLPNPIAAYANEDSVQFDSTQAEEMVS